MFLGAALRESSTLFLKFLAAWGETIMSYHEHTSDLWHFRPRVHCPTHLFEGTQLCLCHLRPLREDVLLLAAVPVPVHGDAAGMSGAVSECSLSLANSRCSSLRARQCLSCLVKFFLGFLSLFFPSAYASRGFNLSFITLGIFLRSS